MFATESFDTLRCDVPRAGVARVTLSRPKQMNAYTWDMTQELQKAVSAFRDDDDFLVLMLRGEGDRAFCAGGDIGGHEPEHRARVRAAPMGSGREMRDGMQQVLFSLRNMDKPTVAMIQGYAVAGGLALALACDFRLGGPDAKLGDTSNRFGLLPDEGGAWLFPHVMGYDRALKMILFHEIYDAETAYRLGLLTEVVHQKLEERTLEFCETLAAKAPLAVRMTKMMVSRAMESTFHSSLGDAQWAVMVSNPTEDAQEAQRAFREKRAPKFKGR